MVDPHTPTGGPCSNQRHGSWLDGTDVDNNFVLDLPLLFKMHKICAVDSQENYYNSSSGDKIPERDVTYHLLFTYLPLNYDTLVGLLPEYFFLSRLNDNCYLMDVGLRKAPCIS